MPVSCPRSSARLGRTLLRPLAVVVLGSALVACAARRSLTITSTPPGALVRLDDAVVGPTPARIPFEYYGIRRVTLYLEGYHTHSEQIELDPPWYARFPLDIVSEVLLPVGWRDHRALHVELSEGQNVEASPALSSVFQRAEILQMAGTEGPRQLPTPVPRSVPSVAPAVLEELFPETPAEKIDAEREQDADGEASDDNGKDDDSEEAVGGDDDGTGGP